MTRRGNNEFYHYYHQSYENPSLKILQHTIIHYTVVNIKISFYGKKGFFLKILQTVNHVTEPKIG